ncbi:SusC/RagA family TonB-linked outer membrane protein [Sunxiuqinia elliptica]|uniref:TonB-linked SusC/RagA family outer membrane protein n=1 Tax=Sunxiuqinia elliptica TaxID=655355 RepID=A0A4R6GPQ4_9BACT|nr:TonB-dependent receptor [Sunxiuqinia elliptica]TDN97123.1 TonB-linked SusC/RagA family outer membrane protein [Sunxiuqinia elliptica]TDO60692.1 TonB-linked SusC/RagA family outer membrane protein [Sunxiuqinia elliptica]
MTNIDANDLNKRSVLKNYIRRMRLLVICLILGLQMSYGENSYSQTVTISLNTAGKTVKSVLDEISQKTEFVFIYQDNSLDLDRRVHERFEEQGINHILDALFKDTDNAYVISGRQVYITKKKEVKEEYEEAQQTKRVTGKITDSKGESLIGVNVVIKGTLNGTITDVDGNFEVNVVPGQTLVISFIGFKKQEILINDQSQLTVIMEEDQTQLDDVVVVGYGNQKKASVVGSVQSIQPAELKVPSTQLSTSFAGRVAGLIAVQRSGQPGADGANFWIRGISTFGGTTSPLIILDGVQISSGDLNNIDPEIIESFSILKDATATALYGTLGANGVMIITTKTGKNLTKPQINVRVESSIASPTYKVDLVDGVKYMTMYNEAQKNPSSSSYIPYAQSKINGTIAGDDPLLYPNVDWYDELFNNYQTTQKGIVNITGGSEKVDYFTSLSASHETGLLKSRSKDYFSYNNNIRLWRYNFQNNLRYNLTSSTKVALRLNVQLRDENSPNKGTNSLFSSVINSNPVDFPIMYPTTDQRIMNMTSDHIMWGGKANTNQRQENPLAEMIRGFNSDFQSTVIAALQLDQKLDFITKGLNFSGLYSFKNWSRTHIARSANYNQYYLGNVFYNQGAVSEYDLVRTTGSPVSTVLDIVGGDSFGRGDRTMYFQAQLNYKRTLNDIHTIGAMALYNQNEFNINTPTSLKGSLPKRKQGLAGRLTYGLKNRYMAEFNFGYNGSENFAKGHRFGFFPSFALGYNVSEEPYWESIKPIVSHLKIRGSWGKVGNDQTSGDRFLYLADINLEDAGYRTGIEQNYSQSGPVYNRYQNDDLSWEIGTKTNIGIDLQLFDSFEFVFDIFKEKRENIFLQRQAIPNFFGTAGTKIYGNLGVVENKGFDGAINYNKQVSPDLFVSVKGTYSFAKNKILEYDEPAFREYPGNSRVGHSVNQYLLYTADRLFIDNAEVENSPTQLIGGFINGGDIKYVDIPNINGETDGQIDQNDRRYMGHPSVPEFVYGLGTSVQYRKWDFSLFFQGVARTSLVMNNFHPFGNSLTRNVLEFIADDYWSENNQNIYAKYPRLSIADNPNNTVNSTYWLRDASFLKLKNLEFGYSHKYLRVYLSGTNLLTFSKFKEWDPEKGGGSGLSYPTMRVFNLGIQLTL